ncbi:MAG TPA: CAP domain-containing protein [Pyrinomonadaceae bacterium]|nr:CAP domain-containing protein [Pyrinomonadaceae bacterium]
MLTRWFPRRAALGRVSQALFVALSLGLSTAPTFAKDGARTAPTRPAARLLSASKQEVPSRVRARLVARASGWSPAYAPSAAAAVAATADERRAFELINAERRRRGRGPLAWDGSLTRMARYHSENMARQGFFNHVDREGLDLSGRAQVLGVRGWRALGENIAYNQGYPDPTAFAVERWMISNAHRANILNGEFTHAGLGIARGADGRVFFTQVFMRR